MRSIGAEGLAALGPLLDHALDLTPDECSRWLAELREQTPAVAEELAALLGKEGELAARGFLAERPGDPLLAPVPPGGGRIGPYTLVQPLGQGGMGSVWLGRRTDGRYEGDVAIKLLSFAMLSANGAERFRREAQALARLTHPNIGRLIDAGVTETGHAFLVLEYVAGTPLDRHCDERRLSPSQRLSLFRQLLAAVAHAHANLIVHRDIKPSNVLVTHDGQVKLLDFGIAKLLQGDAASGEATALTRDGGMPFTAEYAAPEQLTGSPVTTAVDVYALGVVLYKLLAGRHPTGPGLETTAQHVRATMDVEPPRLSTAVTDAEARGTTPERLRRLYAGDLDSILATALQKDPAQRYPTVTELADDLDRSARHEPIHAHTASLAYRARKFVRRNRAAVALGLVVAAALLAATVVTSAQMLEARRQRDRARFERDRAVDQEQRATASNGFMGFLLEDIATSGKSYTTLGLLDRARVLLDKEYREDPRFAARMMVDLSIHYYRLRDRHSQYALLQRADQLATDAGDPETVASADCWLGMTHAFDGEVAAARLQLDRAERVLSRVTDPPLALRIRCLVARSNLARRTGQVDSALGFARRAVALSAAAGDTASYRHQAVLNELAGALGTAGRFREALAVTRTSLALLRRTGRDSTGTMTVELYNQARALFALGELRASADSLAVTINLARAMDAGGGVPAYMEALSGDLAEGLGQPAAALAALARARADARAQGDRSGEARALASLVRVLLGQGQLERADQETEALGWLLPQADRSALSLLAAYRARSLGQWAQAEELFLRYLNAGAPLMRSPGTYRYPHVVTLAACASLRAGDARAADTLAGRALRLARAEGDDTASSGVVGDALALQARARLAEGDTSAAGDLLRRAAGPLSAGYGADNWRVLEARGLLNSLVRGLADRHPSGRTAGRC